MSSATVAKSNGKLNIAESVFFVPLDRIEQDGLNVRRKRPDDEQKIAELMASIQKPEDLNQPILLFKNGKKLLIGFGHRRFEAHKRNKLATIKALVREMPKSRGEIEVLRAIENLKRQDLTPVEEAIQVIQVLEQTNNDITAAAKALGQDETWIRDRMYLSRLCPEVRALVLEGRCPLGHARELAKLGHGDQRDLKWLVDWDKDGHGGHPLAQLKHNVMMRLRSLAVVPWELDKPFKGVKGVVGKCTGCKYNTGTDRSIFEHDGKETTPEPDMCMNQECFTSKKNACETALSKMVSVTISKKLPAQAETVAKLMKDAPFVKTKTAVRRAQNAVKDPEKSKQKKANDKPEATYEELCRRAENEHHESVRKWVESADETIAEACRKKPGHAISLFLCGQFTPPYNATLAQVESKYAPCYKQIFAPENYGKDIAKLEKTLGLPGDSWFHGYGGDAHTHIRKVIAGIIGVKLPDMPVYVKPDSPEEVAKKAAGVGA